MSLFTFCLEQQFLKLHNYYTIYYLDTKSDRSSVEKRGIPYYFPQFNYEYLPFFGGLKSAAEQKY
jgi:hypothetical protein